MQRSAFNLSLHDEVMLGHSAVGSSVSQCEYQFGRRLVHVQHPTHESPAPYIDAAQVVLGPAWQDIEGATVFAEQLSRAMFPELWAAHDASGKEGFRLDVYAIRFTLDDPCPKYTLGPNHYFDVSCVRYDDADLWRESPIVEELPEFPPNFLMSIRRVAAGEFENAT